MTQWVLGGVLGYAPLLGIPSPADLRREDAALHRLLRAGLGVRSTSERVSLSAPRSAGGLGIHGTSQGFVTVFEQLWTPRQPSYHGTAALLPQPYTSSQATVYTSTCRPTVSLVAYWIT